MRATFLVMLLAACAVLFTAHPAKAAKPESASAASQRERANHIAKLNRELDAINKDPSPMRAAQRYRAIADRLLKSDDIDDLSMGASSLSNLTSLLVDMERYDEAIEAAQRGITFLWKKADPRLEIYVASMYYNQAAAFSGIKDEDQRRAQLEQIVRLFQDSENPRVLSIVASANIDFVDDLILAGRLDEASESLRNFHRRFLWTDALVVEGGGHDFSVTCPRESPRKQAVDCIPNETADTRYYARVAEQYWEKICSLKPDCRPEPTTTPPPDDIQDCLAPDKDNKPDTR